MPVTETGSERLVPFPALLGGAVPGEKREAHVLRQCQHGVRSPLVREDLGDPVAAADAGNLGEDCARLERGRGVADPLLVVDDAELAVPPPSSDG